MIAFIVSIKSLEDEWGSWNIVYFSHMGGSIEAKILSSLCEKLNLKENIEVEIDRKMAYSGIDYLVAKEYSDDKSLRMDGTVNYYTKDVFIKIVKVII